MNVSKDLEEIGEHLLVSSSTDPHYALVDRKNAHDWSDDHHMNTGELAEILRLHGGLVHASPGKDRINTTNISTERGATDDALETYPPSLGEKIL